MKSKSKEIPRCVFLIFPVLVTVVVSILIPETTELIGFLMLGNLIKECGVLEKLSKTAQNELSTFPMASRTVQALALEEDDQNFILMHAVSANVSGQIGSLLIAGIIMQFLSIC